MCLRFSWIDKLGLVCFFDMRVFVQRCECFRPGVVLVFDIFFFRRTSFKRILFLKIAVRKHVG